MSTPYKFIQVRADFGNVILAWFQKNDWPQNITEAVAKELNIEGGPWASQVSTAINAKLDPKAAFMIAFGVFNLFIHKGDFSKIKDKSLKEKLNGSKALTLNNGRPFDGSDFFRLFTGMIEVPKKYKVRAKDVDSNQIKKYGELLANHFLKIQRTEMLSAKEAWQLFLKQPYVKTIKEGDQLIINDLLRGEIDLTLPMIETFSKAYGKCPVMQAFRTVSKVKFTKELQDSNSIIESLVPPKKKPRNSQTKIPK